MKVRNKWYYDNSVVAMVTYVVSMVTDVVTMVTDVVM